MPSTTATPIPTSWTRTRLAGRRGRNPQLALAVPTWTRILLLVAAVALMVIQAAVDGSFGYRDHVLTDPTDLRLAAHVATLLGLLAVFAAWPIRVRITQAGQTSTPDPDQASDQTSPAGVALPRLVPGEEEASTWPLDQTSSTDQTSALADRWPDQTSDPDQASDQASDETRRPGPGQTSLPIQTSHETSKDT